MCMALKFVFLPPEKHFLFGVNSVQKQLTFMSELSPLPPGCAVYVMIKQAAITYM